MENIKTVDARGLSCPEPVIQAKRAIKDNPDKFLVLINTEVARDNVKRLLEKSGYEVNVDEEDEDYKLTAAK